MNYVHKSIADDEINRKALKIARVIDSTLLAPKARTVDFERLFEDAIQFEFRSVCVPPTWVSHAKSKVPKSTMVCTVIGFPCGYNPTQIKVEEAKMCLDLGADELDFVQNPYAVDDSNWSQLFYESHAISNVAKQFNNTATKVILETSLLSPDQIEACALIHARAGVSYIKTSTGFGTRGANPDDILSIKRALEMFKQESGLQLGIKASGGIGTLKEVEFYLNLGVHRIGTSQGKGFFNDKPQSNSSSQY